MHLLALITLRILTKSIEQFLEMQKGLSTKCRDYIYKGLTRLVSHIALDH